MGKVICAGLGPGDPDLMSVRSDRLVRSATHIAYFRKKGYEGQARRIVDGMLRPDAIEFPMDYPVTTEIAVTDPDYNRQLAAFYDDWAEKLALLAGTETVLVLCEGDPFFYGSFMHLYTRLREKVPVEVVPGITGMSGCWTATGEPITWGDDVLTVLTATMAEADLTTRARETDALVVMKIGRNLDKLKRALTAAGRLQDAWLVERGTMPDQRVHRLCDAPEKVPYFSIAVVHGQGRRP